MNLKNKKLYFLNQIILLIVFLLINAILINPVYAKTSDEWVTDGVSLLEIGEYSSALVAFDMAITENSDNEMAWMAKGLALFALERYEEAITAFDRVLVINPGYAAAWSIKGSAFYKSGEYEEAITAYDRAIAINPDDAYTWVYKGISLNELCRYEEAIIAYDRGLAIDPNYAKAWHNKGLAVDSLGRYEEAITAYDRAIAIDPDDADVWNNKGYALASLERYEEAITAYDRAIAINLYYTTVWHNKGISLHNLGRHEEAIIAYNRAIAIDPNLYLTWCWKGITLHDLGKYEEAIIAYDNAIAINPNFEDSLIGKQISINMLNDSEQFVTDKVLLKEPDVPTVEEGNSIKLFAMVGAVTLLLIFGVFFKKSKNSVKTIEEKHNNIFSIHNLSIIRETEFYQGFIRLKMSITNTTISVITDVNLDFYFDKFLLRMDRYEPDYPINNGKIIFGNINSGSSKSVAVYFDPMMCSKGTEIKCQINYMDAKGQLQTTWMEPKSISVVCPMMETDSDINIGILKDFVEKLPHKDSKIYQIHAGFEIGLLKSILREVIQKHNVKHIRTLYTKDGKTCEMWYYGKTKVNNHDIVIKITISSENQSIELFAATQTAESLTGLLAEFGRELLLAIEDKITGKNNVNQVINVSIKDSIIQRSNLLSYCDIDGKCTGDVIVEDSIVQRSDIGLNAKTNDSFMQNTVVGSISCPVCGGAVLDGAKFCNKCGGKLK